MHDQPLVQARQAFLHSIAQGICIKELRRIAAGDAAAATAAAESTAAEADATNPGSLLQPE